MTRLEEVKKGLYVVRYHGDGESEVARERMTAEWITMRKNVLFIRPQTLKAATFRFRFVSFLV